MTSNASASLSVLLSNFAATYGLEGEKDARVVISVFWLDARTHR